MKVIWRQKDKDWEIAFGKSYKDEAQLQSFLAEYPSMIPFEDVSEEILHPRVMLKEVGLPGSGSTDIVGVDESGGITVLECKLATNPEVKRKVIGQVLEYAAFLWRKPYGFLDEVSELRLHKPLAEAMRASLSDELLQDWSEADFVQSASDRLQSGDFQIVVAVDAINDELRKTIEYLTEGPSRLQIYALELTYFASGEQEILVPHLHGSIAAAATPSRATSTWDAERFFADVDRRKLPEEEVDRVRQLLEFCGEAADRTWWGHGKETGSFTFHLVKEGQTVSIFSVFSDGRLQVNFGWLRERAPADVLISYRDRLHAIPTLKNLPLREDFNSWPTFRLRATLSTTEELDAFKAAVLWLRDRLLEEQ
jgi:hypothetical protein